MNVSTLAPTTSKERILALDILRGIALLGILIINMQSFAMPGAAYLNPTAYGDLMGINKWVWILGHVLADSKMMAIFSILFGAGVLLVTDRAKARTGRSAGLHYSRSFWLLVFGLIHAHLIWSGDILVTYALCAFIVYLFRNKKARTLIIIGLILISIHTLIYILFGLSVSVWPDEQLADAMNDWKPGTDLLNAEIAQMTGSISEVISKNSSNAVMMETLVFPILFLWRATGLMLIGMAFYKLDILTAKRSVQFYKKGMVWGWLLGFPLVIFGVWQNFQSAWSYEYSMFFGGQFNYWGSLGVSFGYICAIMLFVKSDRVAWLQDRLAAVGQMAFTNYIAQSVICIVIFWGWGFGLFGQLDRLSQFFVILGVWIIQLIWSGPWLRSYKFGPLEWLWRTLAYRKIQPMKRV